MGIRRLFEENAELILGGLSFRDVLDGSQHLEWLAGKIAAEHDLMAANPSPGAVGVSATKLGLDDLSVVNVLETTSGIIKSQAGGIVRMNQPGDQ